MEFEPNSKDFFACGSSAEVAAPNGLAPLFMPPKVVGAAPKAGGGLVDADALGDPNAGTEVCPNNEPEPAPEPEKAPPEALLPKAGGLPLVVLLGAPNPPNVGTDADVLSKIDLADDAGDPNVGGVLVAVVDLLAPKVNADVAGSAGLAVADVAVEAPKLNPVADPVLVVALPKIEPAGAVA